MFKKIYWTNDKIERNPISNNVAIFQVMFDDL